MTVAARHPVVEARNVTKRYGRTVGVQDISFAVEPGEVFGFLGPNGSGKTTTIRLLLDLIRPTRGEVRVVGRSPCEPAARRPVGYLPGELSFWWQSARPRPQWHSCDSVEGIRRAGAGSGSHGARVYQNSGRDDSTPASLRLPASPSLGASVSRAHASVRLER